MRYRKKPVVVEAFRLSRDPMPDWFMDRVTTQQVTLHRIGPYQGPFHQHEVWATIMTLEAVMKADPGDWIIKGVKGELYPCKDDIFRATYEEVEDLS